jgi:hypothetical protein
LKDKRPPLIASSVAKPSTPFVFSEFGGRTAQYVKRF